MSVSPLRPPPPSSPFLRADLRWTPTTATPKPRRKPRRERDVDKASAALDNALAVAVSSGLKRGAAARLAGLDYESVCLRLDAWTTRHGVPPAASLDAARTALRAAGNRYTSARIAAHTSKRPATVSC